MKLHESSPNGSPPTYEVSFVHDAKIPVRDGIRLSADLFLPRDGGTYPTIVLHTPYESNSDRHLKWGVWWARRGYAAVVQDCRGLYQSEGIFHAYLDDGPDTFDTLDWIANQPWSNGKVGTWGRSYGGLYQWLLAPLGNKHLTCMAPHVFPEDYFDECHYVGGAFQLALSALAAVIWVTNYATINNSADVFFTRRYSRHLPLIDLDVEAIGRKIPFYREWLEHQTDDEYWKALSMIGKYGDVSVPIFQQAGWYDPYAGSQLKMWRGMTDGGKTELARANQRILIGPWGHNPPESSQFGDIDFGPDAFVNLLGPELRWFDHWLKGIDTGLLDEPPIQLFVMGDNVWRSEREWPLTRAKPTPYFLHSDGRANSLEGDGRLDPDPPDGETPDHFDYDPNDPVPSIGGNSSIGHWAGAAADPVISGPIDQRPIERRGDVLVYTSRALELDLEVTGPIDLVLYAASSARDTDFVVKLIDVFPDGRAINLSDGIIRARYRKSREHTDLLEPGEVAEYRIRMCVTSNVFKQGHRIRLDITSSNFPRFSRNLNTGDDVATGTRMQVAHQTVLHSSRYPSHVVLPVVPR
jgi:putative CocE/NonD family hydrolase